MVTVIIVICIVISVAIICYTYYRIEELRQCLISNDNDMEITLNTISRLIDKYSETINNKTLTPTGFIDVNSINTFHDTIRVIINIDEEREDYDED